ncbi:MAG: Tim44 domain-containing protein, partial [Clostridiales bacterium]|nr:Tim44 domain-containing protein [Clostridiales bacterium]
SSWGDDDYYYSDGGGGDGFGITIVVVVIIVIYVFISGRKKGKATVVGAGAEPTTNLMPLASLLEIDSGFSEAAMKEKISNLYVQMQNAWQDKKFESMRPHMTDSLYNQFARQLDELVRAGNTNYVERIAVLSVNFTGWRQDEVNDSIVALVKTRIVDYTLNDRSGKLVSGSKTAEKFLTYEWTLIRSKGMTTPQPSSEGSQDTVSIRCPSCSAPLEVNQSAKCPYCDSVITARDYDWAISAIKGISQTTSGR